MSIGKQLIILHTGTLTFTLRRYSGFCSKLKDIQCCGNCADIMIRILSGCFSKIIQWVALNSSSKGSYFVPFPGSGDSNRLSIRYLLKGIRKRPGGHSTEKSRTYKKTNKGPAGIYFSFSANT